MSKEVKATKSAKELADDKKIKLEDIEAPAGVEITVEMVEAHIEKLKSEGKIKETKKGRPPSQQTKKPKEEEPEENPAEETKTRRVKEVLVCVYTIKEDGAIYKPGEVYGGKRSKYLLSKKSIKKAYKEV